MKYKTNVFINLEDENINETVYELEKANLSNYNIFYTINPFKEECISLNIIASQNDSFDNLINESRIKEELLNTKLIKDDFFVEKRNIKLINAYLEKSLYINTNEIVIAGEYDQILKFMLNNDSLKEKKVAILIYRYDELPFSELLENIKNDFKDFKRLYIQTPENNCVVLLQDYLSSLEYINNLVDHIKSLNLSKMEQVMYAYDIVRSRIYKKEERYEGSYLSREITYVLNGDKIVCAGYARLFNTILKKLNINTYDSVVKNNETYCFHMRSVAYIKDEHYNIEGIYYFDPTWDAKKENDNDNTYLNKYKYFAKTKYQIENMTHHQYKDKLINNRIPDIIKDIEKSGINHIKDDSINEINVISKLVYNKKYLNPFQLFSEKDKQSLPEFLKKQAEVNLEKLKEDLQYFHKLLNTKIDGSCLFDVYLNVKLKQYLDDDNLHSLSKKKLAHTAASSNWDIREKERLLLYLIFDEPMSVTSEKIYKEAYMELKQRDFDRNIMGMKLVKVLKKVQTKKEN